MSPKRSAAVMRSSSLSSDSADERIRKRVHWDSENKLKIYIVQAKIEEKNLFELHRLIESSQVQFELSSDSADADVIITNIRMKKRLERHIPWDVAKQTSVVTPAWLYQSIKDGHPVDCGAYAAIQELNDETVEHCPGGPTESDQSSTTYTKSVVIPTNPRVFKNWAVKHACQRASPLTCVNQALALELNVLARSRELESLSPNALSYEKSVGIIKSYPYLITHETFESAIKKLPGFGSKTLFKLEEFLNKGFIEESRKTRNSERFQVLSLFASIYGIGPFNARKLYDLGLRTIEDLERYYDLPTRGAGSQGDVDLDTTAAFSPNVIENELAVRTPNGKVVPLEVMTAGKHPGMNNAPPDMSIKIALMMREDLEVPIPREEVEEIHRVVMGELKKIQPGCISTIVGGYRRGKEQSNDVDIVIGFPDIESGAGKIKDLCKRFTQHLHKKGLVTHIMHLSSFHVHNALRTSPRDSLEKALTVFVLPLSNGKDPHLQRRRIHRRLDLIFAAPEAYWTAVVGWTGSRLFERDLRTWAKGKGFKFDSSGLTRRHDSRLFIPRSEQEIFNILGLDWIDPTMRNANV